MSDYFVHESSYVDDGAEIGAGTRIWHFCHVMPRAQIGERCNIGQNVLISSEVIIGNNVKIQNNVSLYTGVIVEDDVFLGPSMVFTNVINPRSHVSRRDEYKKTLVCKGASIGANATIVCGTTLGRYCFVGAGSVVTKDVPDYTLVYGSPARLHGWMCQCGEQLKFEGERAVCKSCGDIYRKQDQVVVPEKRRRMIPLVDLKGQYHSIKSEIDQAVLSTLESGHFILGPMVGNFEESIASYLGVKHAIGLASGTDALVLALRAMDIGAGDEVIVPAYTFFATAGTVMSVGAKPVFVDVDPQSYQVDVNSIKNAITSKTKAIIPVHLYGHPAEMNPILEIAHAHDLKVIEDNAQAFGAEYLGKKTGSFGDIGCLSFFPTKNLGAFGDAGGVVTNDDSLAERMRMLRTHGWKKKYYSEEVGYNSRLDALQAAILQAKLPHLDLWNEKRREISQRYSGQLEPLGIGVPVERPWGRHVYHLYVIRSSRRDELQAFLKGKGIAAEVYYPLPLHLSVPCRKLGYEEGDFPHAELASHETLALPLYPELTLSQQDEVIAAVKVFMG